MTPGEQVRQDAFLGTRAERVAQIKKRAESFVDRPFHIHSGESADALWLLSELEQAERERDDMRETADAHVQNFVKADKERRQFERERDEFEQACATAGEIIADLRARLEQR